MSWCGAEAHDVFVASVYLLVKSFNMGYMLRWPFCCCTWPMNFAARCVVVLLRLQCSVFLLTLFGLVWLIDALLQLLWIQSALFYMQTCQILFYTFTLIVGKGNEYFGCEKRSLQECITSCIWGRDSVGQLKSFRSSKLLASMCYRAWAWNVLLLLYLNTL